MRGWQPETDDFGRMLAEQNPWKHGDVVPVGLAPPRLRYLARHLGAALQRKTPSRFELVLGPRRAGKTTAMYQSVRQLMEAGVPASRIWWLRLDHPLLINDPLDAWVRDIVNTAKATADSPCFLFLDEVTYARDWDLWLKTFYDDHWPVRIAATSSSTAAMRQRRMESGVGRWEEQALPPCLFGEYLDLISTGTGLRAEPDLASTIKSFFDAKLDDNELKRHRHRYELAGGFPEILLSADETGVDDEGLIALSQRMLRSDAVERAIYKDIPQAFGIDHPMMLERLLCVLAAQVSSVLSPRSLCTHLHGLSIPTFDRYLGYLERSFLVFTTPNYSGSEKAIQKRGRKLYFVDHAVRNAALQRGVAMHDNPAERGLLLENIVAAHLHALAEQEQVRLFHWRHSDLEVDLVYDHPEQPMAFEVASSAGHSRKGLFALLERHPRFRGRAYVVSLDPLDQVLATKDRVGSVSLDRLLLALSCQFERATAARLGAADLKA